MQGEKDCSSLRICQGRAVVKGWIVVSRPCLYYLESLRFESSPHLRCEIQYDIAFAHAAYSARARIGSSVRRVEHDDI